MVFHGYVEDCVVVLLLEKRPKGDGEDAQGTGHTGDQRNARGQAARCGLLPGQFQFRGPAPLLRRSSQGIHRADRGER